MTTRELIELLQTYEQDPSTTQVRDVHIVANGVHCNTPIVDIYNTKGGSNPSVTLCVSSPTVQHGVVIGGTYRHFKGHLVTVIAVSEHTETKEMLVVYRHHDNDIVYSRPISMFTSAVDTDKYPDVSQRYRFEYCHEV